MRNLRFVVVCVQLTKLLPPAGCVPDSRLPHDGPASGGGPYNLRVGEGGDGIKRPWNSVTVGDMASAPWSISVGSNPGEIRPDFDAIEFATVGNPVP